MPSPGRRAPARSAGAGALGADRLNRWLVVFVVMVFPVYWMVVTAFKPGIDIQSYTPKFFPHPATLAQLHRRDRPRLLLDVVKNSLIVVVVVTVLSLVLAFLAALALAKFRFYGRRAFIIMVIVVQMVPLNGADHPALHPAQPRATRWTSSAA